jgi:hypothetical protein
LDANQGNHKSDVVLSLNDSKLIWRKDHPLAEIGGFIPFLLGKERVYFMDGEETGRVLAACSLQTGDVLYCTTFDYDELDDLEPVTCQFTALHDGNNEILVAMQSFCEAGRDYGDWRQFVSLINGATGESMQYPLACGPLGDPYIQTICGESTPRSPKSFRVIGGLSWRVGERAVKIIQNFSKQPNGIFDVESVEAVAIPAGDCDPNDQFHKTALVGWSRVEDTDAGGYKAFKMAQSSDPVFHKELHDAALEACWGMTLGFDRCFRAVEIVDFKFPEGINAKDCESLTLVDDRRMLAQMGYTNLLLRFEKM